MVVIEEAVFADGVVFFARAFFAFEEVGDFAAVFEGGGGFFAVLQVVFGLCGEADGRNSGGKECFLHGVFLFGGKDGSQARGSRARQAALCCAECWYRLPLSTARAKRGFHRLCRRQRPPPPAVIGVGSDLPRTQCLSRLAATSVFIPLGGLSVIFTRVGNGSPTLCLFCVVVIAALCL